MRECDGHGRRAASRTWAAEVVNAREDVAETALAHVVGSKTVRAYNRSEHLDERHVLTEKWGLWVLGDHMPFNDMNTINGEVMKRWVGVEDF
jgi:hypothetical protein